MSYYWFNRSKILKMHGINIIIKDVKKKLLSIMLLTEKFQEKMQEIIIKTCQKKKKM